MKPRPLRARAKASCTHCGAQWALWQGKKLFDDDGQLAITVSKTAPAQGEDYHVDALSGATLTSNGVDNLVRFWMGEAGYGAFLDNLRAGEI